MNTEKFEALLTSIKNNWFIPKTISFQSYQDDDGAISDAEIKTFVETLLQADPTPKVESISLYGCSVTDKSLAELAKIKSLQELDVSNGLYQYPDQPTNTITSEGLASLNHSNIQKLNVSGNPIGNAGIIALSQNKTIFDLDISDCEINDVGANVYFEHNTTVRFLNISSNCISGGLSNLLNNTNLEKITAFNCNLTSADAINISKNTSLKQVYIHNNSLIKGIEVAEAFLQNKNLDTLNLTDTGITSDDEALLKSSTTIKHLYCDESEVRTLSSFAAKRSFVFMSNDAPFVSKKTFEEQQQSTSSKKPRII